MADETPPAEPERLPGERVLWQGQSSRRFWAGPVTMVGFGIVLGIAAVLFGVIWVLARAHTVLFWLLSAALGAFTLNWLRLLYLRGSLSRTTYQITDQRAILNHRGRVESVPLSLVPADLPVRDEDPRTGVGTLRMKGDTVESGGNSFRVTDDNITFVAIPDVRRVRQLALEARNSGLAERETPAWASSDGGPPRPVRSVPATDTAPEPIWSVSPSSEP